MRDGSIFGLIECDVSVPFTLHAHFSEIQPVFKNIRLTRDDLGRFMRRYAEEHDIMTTQWRMLVGSFHGDKILLATPLLRWYMEHGLEVTRVYQAVEYTPIPCFRRFGEAVSTARREGDVHHDVAGELGLREDHHQRGSTSRREILHGEGASLMVNDRRFRQLDVVVDNAYEIAMNKKTVTYALLVHVGFFILGQCRVRGSTSEHRTESGRRHDRSSTRASVSARYISDQRRRCQDTSGEK